MIPYLLFPKWISSHRVSLPTGGKATRIYDKQNFQRYLENAFEGVIPNHLIIPFLPQDVNIFKNFHGFTQFNHARFGERGKETAAVCDGTVTAVTKNQPDRKRRVSDRCERVDLLVKKR
ncbi:MAG: hypothetical protein IKU90_02530 [Clostridia bacterium]|nr:hypothetical protein [Clostridia bacterium]